MRNQATSLPASLQRKVLLVDTATSTRSLRAKALRDRGLDVVCAGGLSEGRSLWQPNAYKLVLMHICNDCVSCSRIPRRDQARQSRTTGGFLCRQAAVSRLDSRPRRRGDRPRSSRGLDIDGSRHPGQRVQIDRKSRRYSRSRHAHLRRTHLPSGAGEDERPIAGSYRAPRRAAFAIAF